MFFLATEMVWFKMEKAPQDKQFKWNEFSGMSGAVWWCSGQHRFSSFHQLAQIIDTSLIGDRGANVLSLRTTSDPGCLSYQAENSTSHCPLLMGVNWTDRRLYCTNVDLTYFTQYVDRNEDQDERSQKAAFDIKEGTADCEDW